MKHKTIHIQNIAIQIVSEKDIDYISLTDMIKAKDGDFFTSDWLRNRNTIEFLGIWEEIHNPDFNYGEFAIVKSKVGLNSYKISIKEWVEKTNAIGLIAKEGRYGGTFAYKDIAFEFGMWISPRFKLHLIKEFERLKTEESERNNLDWNAKRMLTKINYKIHTDSIKENIIIPQEIDIKIANLIYASEADVLNVALFGLTAQEWKNKNLHKEGNIRDYSDVYQLVCLSNLESINALLIEQGIPQDQRLLQLNKVAITQMKSLIHNTSVQKLIL